MDKLIFPPWVFLLLPSSVVWGLASYLAGLESVSKENIIFDFALYFFTAVVSFWTTSGIIYPYILIENSLLTDLSFPWSNWVAILKLSILALNLNLDGLPQYESDA